ncbi:serine/threonine-protein phosphatase 4 regulatory subunit 2 isoform X2 [Ricinus communis]|uniref:serine/threonine-protein phosphatase 4 regulatory subunit 2 isoform X2 n=1 Tax=Ricinus communis TaxID=3988 RepID=UPI000772601C|nr:serine/threonine-protein phosphatase 4 regulatory subunit 2 isoform X2 [Ricinus communis]|eukprot:XP_002520013.2 serine/threonine-protein phosphatase 4 regulatory subunit 2 isoform X2 [Ricinus communis]
MSVMPMPSTENSDQPAAISTDTDHPEPDNLVPNSLNHEHDWGKLKSMISFHLKQILSEYPEAKMASEEQSAKLGETYQELVKRLDEALHGFDEGPPFTLQRLCEILLSARSIYPNLSKLALALEKNLLVTSTLTVCTEPYPQSTQKQDEPDKAHEEPQLQHNSIGNGIEPMAGDGDEIMAEVQEADIDDDMTIDMEAFEEIVGSAEQNSTPTGSS